MRFVILDGETVANVAIATEEYGSSQGWIASDTAQIGWLYDGETFTAPPPAPGTVEGVIAERERRLALGFDYDFGDERGVHHIGTTKADLEGWDEVSKAASSAVAVGLGSHQFNIITDTGPVTITAMEWQYILLAAAAFRQPIWAASFALQAMDPIPHDFAADSYWT